MTVEANAVVLRLYYDC